MPTSPAAGQDGPDAGDPAPVLADAAGEYDQFLASVCALDEVYSIGVLPFVYLDERAEPRVTELGLVGAREIARQVSDRCGMTGLAPGELEGELAEAGLRKLTMYRWTDVTTIGGRVGVDALIYGTIERVYHGDGGGLGNDMSLLVELRLSDLRSARVVSASIRLPKGNADHRRAYAIAEQPRAQWRVGRWPKREAEEDVESALSGAVDAVVRRITRRPPFSGGGHAGTVYLMPFDMTGISKEEREFAAAERELMDAMLDWALTVEDRSGASEGRTEFVWRGKRYTVGPNGESPPSRALDELRREWRAFREREGASEVGLLHGRLARRLGQEFRPGQLVVLTDVDVGPEDLLARVREHAEDRDVTIEAALDEAPVVALVPRIERYCESLALRVEVTDLGGELPVSSSAEAFAMAQADAIAERFRVRRAP